MDTYRFAASINIISYVLSNVGRISTASPVNTFILSESSISFIFVIASFALSSSLSIVSIIPVSDKNFEKHILEYPYSCTDF